MITHLSKNTLCVQPAKLDEVELRALGFVPDQRGSACNHLGESRHRCERCGFWIVSPIRCKGSNLCIDCLAIVLDH